MPKVGGKSFGYSKKGKASAKAYAKRTGKRIIKGKKTTRRKKVY